MILYCNNFPPFQYLKFDTENPKKWKLSQSHVQIALIPKDYYYYLILIIHAIWAELGIGDMK